MRTNYRFGRKFSKFSGCLFDSVSVGACVSLVGIASPPAKHLDNTSGNTCM